MLQNLPADNMGGRGTIAPPQLSQSLHRTINFLHTNMHVLLIYLPPPPNFSAPVTGTSPTLSPTHATSSIPPSAVVVSAPQYYTSRFARDIMHVCTYSYVY